MSWLTISINPPVLDKHIVARTSDKFGYGASYEAFIFDSTVVDEEWVTSHLQNHSFIEWLELPE